MVVQDMVALSEAIKRTYKSLEEPDFSFVKKAISSRPYETLAQRMLSLFDVEEITEPNDDVSFRYLIAKSNRRWVIELSMIGRYAVVLRLSDAGAVEIVTPETSVEEERDIFSILASGEVVVVKKKDLERPFPLKLSNTEPENVCVYQALFSDTDVLPWKVKV